MNPFSAFVVFLIIWWLTLFTILPIGVRGQAEEGRVVKGSEPGAPVKHDMWRKVKLTTVIAFIIWILVCAIIISGLFNWDDLARMMGAPVESEGPA